MTVGPWREEDNRSTKAPNEEGKKGPNKIEKSAASIIYTEEGGSRFLRNVCSSLLDHMASHPVTE
jgi:hypothetical protein